MIVDEFCNDHKRWTISSLAKKFGVSPQTFHNWIKSGKYKELIGYALDGLEKEIRYEERPMFEID
jgi:transposase-like protein